MNMTLGTIFQAVYGVVVFLALFAASIVFDNMAAFGAAGLGCFAIIMCQNLQMEAVIHNDTGYTIDTLKLKWALRSWWIGIGLAFLSFVFLVAAKGS